MNIAFWIFFSIDCASCILKIFKFIIQTRFNIIFIKLFVIELILLKLLFQLCLSLRCISEEIIYVLPILVLIFLLGPLTSFQTKYFSKLGSMRCPELYIRLNKKKITCKVLDILNFFVIDFIMDKLIPNDSKCEYNRFQACSFTS